MGEGNTYYVKVYVDCKTCKGKGVVSMADPRIGMCSCYKCNGKGKIPKMVPVEELEYVMNEREK